MTGGEARDRPAGAMRRDELRACACVRRGAPCRRCARPRCLVLPDPRRNVAFASAVTGLESRDVTSQYIRVALSSSLADPLLSLGHLAPCGLRTCLPDPALPASATPVTPPSLRPTDHAAMPSPAVATAGAPSPFFPSLVANMYRYSNSTQYPQSSSCILPLSSAAGQPVLSPLQAVLCLPLDWTTRQSGRRGRERVRGSVATFCSSQMASREALDPRPRRADEALNGRAAEGAVGLSERGEHCT